MTRTRLVIVLAVVGPMLWVFRSALVADNAFVFRDAAHYYHPLYEMTAHAWQSGRVPLWNPNENLGQPLLADATSAVLYPGKLVFALPIRYRWCYKLYVIGHVLLAAGGTYRLARRWKIRRSGSALAALSYAVGGNVLFQYCNVIFLVGAAWLPAAVLLLDRLLVERRLRWAGPLGAVLAMMVLGGDPQMAYHVGLMGGIYAWILWRRERRSGRRVPGSERSIPPIAGGKPPSDGHRNEVSFRLLGHRFLRHRVLLLAAACVVGGLLAAVQILPSAAWSRESTRAAFDAPRSLFEVPAYLARHAADDQRSDKPGVGTALVDRPASGTHDAHVYYFSVGPWRLAELLWPNFSGRQFPAHRRWIHVIPAEGRTWTPSLYMGLLPFLLAAGAIGSVRDTARGRWLVWTAVLAAVASLGWYGLGWCAREMQFALSGHAAADPTIGPQVGGLYWLMTLVLPGYIYFRYPAKLLVPAAMAMSLLAGFGWERTWREGAPRLARVLLLLGSVSAVGAVALFVFANALEHRLADVPADPLFGPIDAAGAVADLRTSMWHTAALCGAFWCLLRLGAGRSSANRPFQRVPLLGTSSAARYTALLTTAVELAVAHAWMAPTAPGDAWRATPAVVAAIEADSPRPKAGACRVFRDSSRGWLPADWDRVSDASRQVDGLRWDRDTLLPKYHLTVTGDSGRIAAIESPGSLARYDYRMFLRVARRYGTTREDGVRRPNRHMLDALGTRYVVQPAGRGLPGTRPIRFAGGTTPGRVDNATLWSNPHALPRARIVHDVAALPPPADRSPRTIQRHTQDVLTASGRAGDFRRRAVVETDLPLPEFLANGHEKGGHAASSCRIVVDRPERVEIEAQLDGAGLLVLADAFDADWRAKVSTDGQPPREATVLRTNRIMRGVALPAGRHRVEYRYRPKRFYIGAAVSITAWCLLAVAAIVIAARRRRK